MDVRDSVRAVLVLSVTAGASALLVAGSHEFSKERIAANEHERLLATLESVLVPGRHDNDLSQFHITVQDPLLGSDQPSEAFVATRAGVPAAILLTVIAPDGYNGAIRLLVGIDAAGAITGVRVLRHRETPGLGDGIEASKSDWIKQFTGKTLDDPPAERWTVKQEEGAFDALTGATITPRAVIKAIKNALLYFQAHRDELFTAAEANTRNIDEPSAESAD